VDSRGGRGETATTDPPAAPNPLGTAEVKGAGEGRKDASMATSEQPLPRALLARIDKRDRKIFFLVSVIALGGLASAVVFGLLLREMQAAGELTRDSIRVYKETTQRQLRAYAGVLDFKCGACGDNAGPEEVLVRADNEGQTPAFNIYGRIGWNAGDMRCGASNSGFSYNYTQARYFKALRTFSKDARDIAAFDVNREVVQEARGTNKRLCVYGSVNYTTIFDDLGERETRFCYWYTRGSDRVTCEDHNGQN